jgi:hypothetical protein
MRVQAVLFELSAIDNGTFAIRQLHLGTSVADRGPLATGVVGVFVQLGRRARLCLPSLDTLRTYATGGTGSVRIKFIRSLM